MAGFGSDLKVGVGVKVDLETLVGDMPAIPCESYSHAEVPQYHSDSEAEFYAQSVHQCTVRSKGEIYAVCKGFAALLTSMTGKMNICGDCGSRLLAQHWVIVVGPINGNRKGNKT